MRFKLWAVVAICAASIFGAPAANATAIAGVDYAFWSAHFYYYTDANGELFDDGLPDGIDAWGFDSAGLTLVNDSAALQKRRLVSKSNFILTNNSDQDFEGTIAFLIDYSAFNPGGSEVGASVTDPSREFASFSSSIFTPELGFLDFHSCDTVSGDFVGPNACGVFSPDSSTAELDFGPIRAHQTIKVPFVITIDLKAQSVPEPLTLSTFGAGLAAIALARRRAKKSAM